MTHTRTEEQQKALNDLLLTGAKVGDLQIIERALERDADADGKYFFQLTPLHYTAVMFRRLEALQALGKPLGPYGPYTGAEIVRELQRRARYATQTKEFKGI